MFRAYRSLGLRFRAGLRALGLRAQTPTGAGLGLLFQLEQHVIPHRIGKEPRFPQAIIWL